MSPEEGSHGLVASSLKSVARQGTLSSRGPKRGFDTTWWGTLCAVSIACAVLVRGVAAWTVFWIAVAIVTGVLTIKEALRRNW